ncbi:MAG TPA: enoyl-CoA hydratase/isomerase family protein [Methylomirabilota bacterium]|jgi:enoyl-CoA hydratase/carnithine racemase|nr:enoyl-CoA hydratase/isomerase family protein [Methylomirabilota bacterium]
MEPPAVRYETRGPVAYLTFDRPHVLNAGDRTFAEAFHAAAERLGKSPEIRVVVLTGAGRAFSTGLDLDALAAGELRYEDLVAWESAMTAIERLECLTIAGINGHCIGGGLQMALVCDYRLASDAALLGLPAVKECLVPSMAPYRLPRLIGLGRAKELILTGELISAARAEAIGLVSRVVVAAEFERALAETVERFLALPVGSTLACKRLTAKAFDVGFDEFREEMQAALRLCLTSDEHRAAMIAVRERKSTP